MRISVPCGAEVALAGARTGTAQCHAQDTTGQAAIARTGMAKTRTRPKTAQNTDAKRGETDTNQRKAEFESPAIPGPATKIHSGETGPGAGLGTGPYMYKTLHIQAQAPSRSSAVTSRVVKRRAGNHCANYIIPQTCSANKHRIMTSGWRMRGDCKM